MILCSTPTKPLGQARPGTGRKIFADMTASKNILLIRIKSIGDVAFTLPAVNAIRDNFSSAKITF